MPPPKQDSIPFDFQSQLGHMVSFLNDLFGSTRIEIYSFLPPNHRSVLGVGSRIEADEGHIQIVWED